MSIRHNTFYNFCGHIFPLVISLLVVPYYLGLIGEARYGVLAIAWALLGYFGLFDFGLSRATAHAIAGLGESSSSERSDVLWTALGVNLVFGLVGAGLLWLASIAVLGHFVDVEEAFRNEVLQSIPWLVASLPIAIMFGSLSGALQGMEKFLSVNIVQVTSSTLAQVLPLLAAIYAGPLILNIVIAALIGKTISVLCLISLCHRNELLQGVPRVQRTIFRNLLSYGGWVTVSSIIGPILTSVDRVIIGAVSGASAVTYYAIPYNFITRGMIIPRSLGGALFPRIVAGTEQSRKELMVISLRSLLSFMMPIIIIGMLFSEPFFTAWISAEFSLKASIIGEIFLLGLWFNCIAIIPYVGLQGAGRPDVVAKIHLIQLVPYLLVLYLFLSFWGVAGAAWAWCLRVFFDALLQFRQSSVNMVNRPFCIGTLSVFVVFLLVNYYPMDDIKRYLSVLTILGVSWVYLNLANIRKRLKSDQPPE